MTDQQASCDIGSNAANMTTEFKKDGSFNLFSK